MLIKGIMFLQCDSKITTKNDTNLKKKKSYDIQAIKSIESLWG